MNGIKTTILLATLTGILVAIGGMLGGQQGMLVALVMAGVMNFASYWFSDRIVLAMYRAQPVTEAEAPELYGMVQELAQRAGMPMPRLYVIPQAQPNAFATGRSPQKAAVAVTAGLLEAMNEQELEGVLAHELAHIKNRDMLISTIAATMAGAITQLAYIAMFFGGRDDEGGSHPLTGVLLFIVAPIAALVIQTAISRQREFEADRVGAQICGKPLSLASALRKLDAQARRIPMDVAPAAAPLAQVNPLAAHGGGIAKLFSTHPPTEERVARLEELSRQM